MISPASTNPDVDRVGRASVFRLTHRDDAVAIVGRQLPGRPVGRQEDRDPPRRYDLWEGCRRVDKEAVESWRHRSDLPGLRPWQGQLWSRNRSAPGGWYRRVHWRIHRDRADGACTRDRGYAVQLVGAAWRPRSWPHCRRRGRGALFVDQLDPRRRAEAAPVVERFRASGYEPEFFTLYAYGAVQVWAQAPRKPARWSWSR